MSDIKLKDDRWRKVSQLVNRRKWIELRCRAIKIKTHNNHQRRTPFTITFDKLLWRVKWLWSCKSALWPPGVAPSLQCCAVVQIRTKPAGHELRMIFTELSLYPDTKPSLQQVDLHSFNRQQLRLHIKCIFQGAYKYFMELPQLALKPVNAFSFVKIFQNIPLFWDYNRSQTAGLEHRMLNNAKT